MEGRTVSASAITDQIIEIDFDDLDSEGRIVQIANKVAASVAQRHTGCACLALGIESLRFINPIARGDILTCRASVNRTWLSSLEVGIKVLAEDFRTLEQKEILSAYFSFAAMDDDHQIVEIAPIIPETPEEIRRFNDAESRHRYEASIVCS